MAMQIVKAYKTVFLIHLEKSTKSRNHHQESFAASEVVRAKDQEIESLRKELAEAKFRRAPIRTVMLAGTRGDGECHTRVK